MVYVVSHIAFFYKIWYNTQDCDEKINISSEVIIDE